MVYTISIMTIRKTGIYKKWIKNLRDVRARAHIDSRVVRLGKGNPGDSKPIGEGCSEMRIDYGPGYRVYYQDTGKEIIILLCGGDKSTQDGDIARAKKIAALPLEEEEEKKDGKDNNK